MLVVSGVYYPVSVLPGWMQSIAKISPATYALRGAATAIDAATESANSAYEAAKKAAQQVVEAAQNDEPDSGAAAHKDSADPHVLQDELHDEARGEAEHAEHVKHTTGPQSTQAVHGDSQDRRDAAQDAGVLTDDEPESRSA